MVEIDPDSRDDGPSEFPRQTEDCGEVGWQDS
jgi:hypothetical protein